MAPATAPLTTPGVGAVLQVRHLDNIEPMAPEQRGEGVLAEPTCVFSVNVWLTTEPVHEVANREPGSVL